MKRRVEKCEYTVVKTGNAMTFVQLVNNLIKIEWKPIGGVSIAHEESGVIFAQALIKTTIEVVDDKR